MKTSQPSSSRTMAGQLGAAANGELQLQRQPPSSSPHKLAGYLGISSPPRAQRLSTRSNHNPRSLAFRRQQLPEIRQLTFDPGCTALIKAVRSPKTTRKRCKVLTSSLLNSTKLNGFWTFLLGELGEEGSEQYTVDLPSVYFPGKRV